MCYIWNCFAWALDVFQRTITFCLACCAACAVCCGLLITVMAGIAYGYNYSFAEFITFTKSDVTVYMRRGQFNDNPDIAPPMFRRMGEDDVFHLNNSEYEEPISNKESESFAEKFLRDQDAREYAVKLTKYSGNERINFDEPEIKEQQTIKVIHKPTLPPTRHLSKIPILIPTTVWRSGNTEIVMRKFLPLNDIVEDLNSKDLRNNDNLYKEKNNNYVTKFVISERQMEKIQPEIEASIDDYNNDIPRRKLLPIINQINYHNAHNQDISEVEDEDNIIYKPV